MPSDSRGYTTELSGLYGRPVVADDVVHTLNYWQGNLTKPNGEPQGTPSAQAHSQTVVSADVIDDKTLRFNLVTTDPFFIATFSQFNAPRPPARDIQHGRRLHTPDRRLRRLPAR